VAWLSNPTITSVEVPRIAPAKISLGTNSPVIDDASAVMIEHIINEWNKACGGNADLVFHHAYALFSSDNLCMGLPHSPAVSAGARMNAVRVRPSN